MPGRPKLPAQFLRSAAEFIAGRLAQSFVLTEPHWELGLRPKDRLHPHIFLSFSAGCPYCPANLLVVAAIYL